MSGPRNSERDRPAVEVVDGRLDSWKEIANYLGRSERTVRRWEQTTGLPIHRLPQKRASVYAFRSELDAWWHKHGSKLEPGQPGAESQAKQSVTPKEVPVLIAVSSAIAVMLAVLLWQVLKHETPRQPSFTPLTFHAGNTTFPAVSRDGKLLAFASDRGADKTMDLWVQAIAGGQAARVTRHGGTNRHLDFSPDGSTIAFRAEMDGGGIYLVPASGGEVRKLTDGGYHPRYSPDGKQISIAGCPKPFLLVKSEEPKIVCPEFDVIGGPALWSKDGKRLLFLGAPEAAHRSPSEVDWWVTFLDGSPPVRTGVSHALKRQGLSPVGLGVFPMDWNDEWAIFSLPSSDATSIWRIPLSSQTAKVTGRAQQITYGQANSAARFLPDGRLVFVNNSETTHIWSVPLDPNRGGLLGEPRQLTRDASLLPEHRGVYPRLSADGGSLVYVSHRNGSAEIWKQNLKTGDESVMHAGVRPDEPILISVDGTKVVFSSQEGPDRAIYMLDTSGRPPSKICQRCGVLMDWSADTRRILFGDGSPQRISLLTLHDGQVIELVKNAQESLRNAVFSPDGGWLAWESGESIVVAHFLSDNQLNTSGAIVVARTIDSSGYPQWSPDGSLLYFLSKENGYRCIWAQRLNPATKTPLGQPIAVWHFHDSYRKIWTIAPFSISQKELVVPVTEVASNIWMAEWK